VEERLPTCHTNLGPTREGEVASLVGRARGERVRVG
jgi:hypothetical protein